jgi:alpha-D-xyloside xylohydrolase
MGNVSVGAFGVGGSTWMSDAALALDFWVTGLPSGADASGAGPIYQQYADATGHAPPLREDAMIFWQSRNRYKSSDITEQVATNYSKLGLPVGVLVVDYRNQKFDGDFNPNPACYPSLTNLSSFVRTTINATTMFSFWPEMNNASSEHDLFAATGCLTNKDLGGYAIDTTITACRDLIWTSFLKPNYYSQGVSAYWLDETDSEGTSGCPPKGYDTSFGIAAAYSQLWVGSWLSTFSRPVALLGEVAPLVLTRGVWAGGQRFGIVLWSSDIQSSFEQLESMIPQGVHSSMSGIPWWTT